MSEALRTEIKGRMEKVMGPYPTPTRHTPPPFTIIEETDCGPCVRQLITYQSEPTSATPAYLLIPKPALHDTTTTLPGILALHPTHHELGHKIPVGLGGDKNRHYAHELAEKGFVVIAPAYPLMANYHPNLKSLGYSSGTMKAIWDNTRALDLLDSLPYIRPGQYGAIGHSLGGHNSLFTAAFDTRLIAIVTSCGFDSFKDYKDGNLSGWAQDLYMPRLSQYPSPENIPFDFDDILFAIAPRAVFISAPLNDDNFKWNSVKRIVENATRRCHKTGIIPHFHLEHPPCAHDFPTKTRDRAYEFLTNQLTKTPPPQPGRTIRPSR